MDQNRNNPPGNTLGGGLTDDKLQKAIELSGYPLQSTATDIVMSVFSDAGIACDAEEEWSFIDEDQGTVRQLDS